MLKNILYLSLLTTFVIIVWIILSVYNNYVTSTISSPLNRKIIPIESSFDTKTLEDLGKRHVIPVDFTKKIVITTSSGETATSPAQTKTATSGGVLNTSNFSL